MLKQTAQGVAIKQRNCAYSIVSHLLAVYLTMLSVSRSSYMASNCKMIMNNDLGSTEGAQNIYRV